MNSLKSIGRGVYLFYFGLLGVLSIVSYSVFGVIVLLVVNSKDVLFISNMVTFHKTILLISVFSIITLGLIQVFKMLFEPIIEIKKTNQLFRIFRRLLLTSVIGFLLITLYYRFGVMLSYVMPRDIVEMNVLAVIVLVLIVEVAYFFKTYYSKVAQTILSVLLLGVFLICMDRVLDGEIPVEFSTVSYLFVPTVFLLRIKKLYITAAYAGIMAGLFYYVYIIINGGSTYHVVAPSEVYSSMFSHGTLLLTGLIALMKIQFSKNEVYLVVLYVLLTVVWAILNRPEYIEFRLFIYELIDGAYLRIFFTNITTVHFVVYYVFVISVLLLTIRGFFKLNKYFTNIMDSI